MAGDGHDGPAFTTGAEAWREAEALARRVLDPAGNVGGRVRNNLAPPLVEDLARRIAAEAAPLGAENARLRAECARLAGGRGPRRFLVGSGGLNEIVEAPDHDAAAEAAARGYAASGSDVPLGLLMMVVEVVDEDTSYVLTEAVLRRAGLWVEGPTSGGGAP